MSSRRCSRRGLNNEDWNHTFQAMSSVSESQGLFAHIQTNYVLACAHFRVVDFTQLFSLDCQILRTVHSTFTLHKESIDEKFYHSELLIVHDGAI